MGARREVENALDIWNGLELEILDFVFKVSFALRMFHQLTNSRWAVLQKFYRNASSLVGLPVGKNCAK